MILANSNPATIMTDPDFADATYVEPLTWEVLEAIIEREHPDAVLPTLGGQTGLNVAMELYERGLIGVPGRPEMIGADADAIATAEDREKFKVAMVEIGLDVPRSGTARDMDEARKVVADIGLPGDHPPRVHPRWARHRDRGHAGRVRADGRQRAVVEPDRRDPRRGVDRRVEGVRARGDARPRRQLRDHLLDRERRPDGCAHRRLDHRLTAADAHRRRVPADARLGDRLHPARRRRDRRIERAVRGRTLHRPPGHHRDEPARVAVFGAGIQGHRLPDRQDRRQARRRLHPRRDPK